jgi:membrane-associated phospholipid phosphatase
MNAIREATSTLVQQLKADILGWPSWWKSLSLKEKYLGISLMLIYWLVIGTLGGFNKDHINVGLAVIILSLAGPTARKILKFLLPLLMVAIVYDSQRYYNDYIRGRVRVDEPYFFDKHFFGIHTAQGILTPNEWFQIHTHPILDFITGFYYITFFVMFVCIAAYFVFWKSRTGTKKVAPARVAVEGMQMMWTFFWTNVLGFSTYYWYPAAPPWYVTEYGLGPANMGAHASAGGAVRFDQLLGTHIFDQLYGRANDVFGAIPSLHVAYPFVAMWFAFRIGAARTFCVIFYLIMCFSAVYLNHHYILDIMWGTAYSIIMALTVPRILDWKNGRALT